MCARLQGSCQSIVTSGFLTCLPHALQARLQAEAARADTADATVASLSAELTGARLQAEVNPKIMHLPVSLHTPQCWQTAST